MVERGTSRGLEVKGTMGLSIGQVAARAGVRASAIRYYEQIGILPAPVRVGGQRRYPELVVKQLAVVRMAQSAGLTLEQIRALFHGFGSDVRPAVRWQHLATARLAELDRQAEQINRMRRALQATLACGCARVEDCAGDGSIGAGNTAQPFERPPFPPAC